MTIGPLRLTTLLTILLSTVSCSGEKGTPTAPLSPVQATKPNDNPTPFVASFPAIALPAKIYVATSMPFFAMHGSPLASRFVLYDDGRFGLQYSSANYPFFEYRGTYKQTGMNLVFEWEGWSVAGAWGATGVLSEETLKVAYNFIMQMSDFEDGTYVRAN